MLTLVTGTPGSGKTLFVVHELSKVTDRTIYHDGIPLTTGKLPWIEISGRDWASVPDGSIVVIDEAQRIWGTRDPKKPVPPEISAMETHRHRGIDIWVITQHPKLLDHHLRRLVGRHVHLRRNNGLPSSLMLDSNEVVDDPQNPDAAVQRSQFLFPSSSYGLYKSAEIHTHKMRITAKMVAMGVLVLASLAAIGMASYRLLSGGIMGKDPQPQAAQARELIDKGQPRAPSVTFPVDNENHYSSGGGYLASMIPESAVVPESAPIYAAQRQIKSVPYLSGCIIVHTDPETCNCYTQKGGRLSVSYAECHAYLDNPPHPYWVPDDTTKIAQNNEQQSVDTNPAD